MAEKLVDCARGMNIRQQFVRTSNKNENFANVFSSPGDDFQTFSFEFLCKPSILPLRLLGALNQDLFRFVHRRFRERPDDDNEVDPGRHSVAKW